MKKPIVVLRDLVSDHAVVRYLERVVGIDPDSIREAIAGDSTALIRRVANGEIKSFQKGLRLVVRGGVVVTVLPLSDRR